jgi:hypothetical protein
MPMTYSYRQLDDQQPVPLGETGPGADRALRGGDVATGGVAGQEGNPGHDRSRLSHRLYTDYKTNAQETKLASYGRYGLSRAATATGAPCTGCATPILSHLVCAAGDFCWAASLEFASGFNAHQRHPGKGKEGPSEK